MRKIITLITTLFLPIVFVLSQNPIPDFNSGKIEKGEVYGIRKWTENEILEMDSILIPEYSEGGVLVDENQFYIEEDTIWKLDITGIDINKLKTITKRVDRNKYGYNSWEFGWNLEDKYSFENLILFQGVSFENIFPLRIIETFPEKIEDDTYYEILPEFINEFSNGLPQKMEIRKYIKKKNPYWITLEEWKLFKRNKKLKKSGNIYFGENNENYWYFEPGYYSWWGKMIRNNMDMTERIQRALKERGYDIEVTKVMDLKTKAALTLFQKENGLPSCGDFNNITDILLGKE